jgi:hypothetical protein
MVYAQAGVAAEVAVAASVSSFALGLMFPRVGGLLALLRHARPSRSRRSLKHPLAWLLTMPG